MMSPLFLFSLRFVQMRTPHELRTRTREVEPVIRVGVMFADLGKLNPRALKYLIVHLNTLQSSIEFELLTMSLPDPLFTELQANAVVGREVFTSKLGSFRSRLKRNIEEMQRDYCLFDEETPDKFIIVSLVRFDDRYYSTQSDGVAVQALGYWDLHMAPPSIVEFILTLLIRQACSHASPLGESVHLGTRGCLFDFTAVLDDARYKSLQAFVCSTCRATLSRKGLSRLADDAVVLLDTRWLGASSDPLSPAGISAKLGYDLFLTRGLKPTFLENVRGLLRDELVKELLKLIFALLLAWALFRFGLKPK